MFDSIQTLLDSFPEGAVQARQGCVLAANEAARRILPELAPGAALPACLLAPEGEIAAAGGFVREGRSYSFSVSQSGQDQLFFFRPAPQAALTGRQLDGALRQLREIMGDFLAQLAPLIPPQGEQGPAAAASRDFHRAFRLLNNLEYLSRAARGEQPFTPAALDLDALCRRLAREAGDLLGEIGVALRYQGPGTGLLIPGDGALLEKMILGLVANAARAGRGGALTLALRRDRQRALLTLSDGGPLPDQRELDALLAQEDGGALPLPGQGAGLGLDIIRDVVGLHRGAMLIQWGKSAPGVMVSLPTGPLDSRAPVRQPRVQRDGGLNPVLVELSDLLPARVFGLEGLE